MLSSLNFWSIAVSYTHLDVYKRQGRAIVACPGGGYGGLAVNHEGYDWAPYFNKQGIALIVPVSYTHRQEKNRCKAQVRPASGKIQ